MFTTTLIAHARLRGKGVGDVLFKYGAQFKIRWAKDLHGNADIVISRLGLGLKLLTKEDDETFKNSKVVPTSIDLHKGFRFSFIVCVGISENFFLKVV
mmetsp:Transcript_25699/g.31586  ORF Transcript_25699/g.31586 Transcript_25699/m.31586 type:complete len:98 (+) Transcript_25699:361-654(+)